MPLLTHTRFNKDSNIESKSRRSTRFCFYFFSCLFQSLLSYSWTISMPCFGTLSFLLFLIFFHFLGPSMMNNFFFLVALCSMRFIFYNGERCVFLWIWKSCTRYCLEMVLLLIIMLFLATQPLFISSLLHSFFSPPLSIFRIRCITSSLKAF